MSAPAVRPPDSRVYETADDAAVSKLSAVRHGYFNDPFMGLFVRRFQRRSPLINRGYFARFLAVDTIVRRFLAVCAARKEKAQIVSLGAGFDATFFRLGAQKAGPSMFLEVDFPDVTVRKASIIAKHAPLLKLIAGQALTPDDMRDVEAAASSQSSGMDAGFGRFTSGSRSAASSRSGGGSASSRSGGGSASATPSSPGAAMPPVPAGVQLYLPGSTPSGGAAAASGSSVGASAAAAAKLGGSSGAGAYVAGPGYRLVTADLRDVASLQAALRNAGVDFGTPTLFLSECVLVYLEPEESCAIIAWAAQAFAASVFVTYEQIRPHDAFGQIMSRNLADRGYTLRGLNAFPDLAAQRARYTELGYGAVSVADMNDVYYRILPPGEVARTERLELFDEVEEWHLMSAHYCIAVAVNDRRAGAAGVVGAAGGPGVAAAAAAAGGSAATAAASTAASSTRSEGGASGGGGAEGASTMAESPKELAAAVVHAHEESAASEGPHGRGRTGSRSSGVGLGLPFPAAPGADAASHDSSGSSPLPAASPASSVHSDIGGGSGIGGGGGTAGFAGGLSIHSARSVQSTASVAGAVTPEVLPPDLRAATEAMAAAAGTAVESVELSDGGSLSSRGLTGDGASPVAALHGAGVAPHAGSAFAFPGHHGTAAAASGGTPGGGSGVADGGGATIATLHTHGGDVIISAHGAVDFEAIAQAEEEMAAARHMRDRANINSEMQRGRSGSIGGAPVLSAGASAGCGDRPRASPGTGPAHGGRRPSGAGVSSGAGAAGSPRIPSYTVEELAAKVKADPRAVSLADVLFPVDAWAAAAGAVATTVGAVAPASASSSSSGQSGGASYRVVRM